LNSAPEFVVALIHGNRITLSNEKAAQAEINELLTMAGYEFTREKRLSPRDTPDFFIAESGLAIEIKMKGAGRMDIFRQLSRYAKHDEVKAILLATNVSMGLPPEIEGKPAYFASLGRAWL
jgi:hypothetical protein